MGFFSSLTSIILFVSNLLIFISGCILIGFGGYICVGLSSYGSFAGGTPINAAIVFMIIGGIVAFISFFGCCGAVTKKAWMLYVYGALMAVIVVAEIGTGIAYYHFKGQAKDIMEKAMKEGLNNYGENDEYTDLLDTLQQSQQCCGVGKPIVTEGEKDEGYKDWKDADFWKGQHQNDVPDSCCKNEIEDCGKGKLAVENPEGIYKDGCLHKMYVIVKANSQMAGGIAIGICLLQILTVIISFCLGKKFKEDSEFA